MHRKIMLLSHTLTVRESDVASLVEFCPVVQEEIVWRADGQMYGRMDTLKNNVALAHPYH